MADVLDLYEAPHDPQRPWVCFDECLYQMGSETQTSQPMTAEQTRRIGYAYKREGTANLFLFLQLQIGWRHMEVTARAYRYRLCPLSLMGTRLVILLKR